MTHYNWRASLCYAQMELEDGTVLFYFANVTKCFVFNGAWFLRLGKVGMYLRLHPCVVCRAITIARLVLFLAFIILLHLNRRISSEPQKMLPFCLPPFEDHWGELLSFKSACQCVGSASFRKKTITVVLPNFSHKMQHSLWNCQFRQKTTNVSVDYAIAVAFRDKLKTSNVIFADN